MAVLATVLIAAVTASAGEDKLAKLKVDLNLTDAQVEQLKAGWDKMQPMYDKIKTAKTELKAMKEAPSPDQSAISAKEGELNTAVSAYKEKNKALFQSVLTKDQYAKFEAMNAQHEKQQTAKNK
jgi:hypothetical protein